MSSDVSGRTTSTPYYINSDTRVVAITLPPYIQHQRRQVVCCYMCKQVKVKLHVPSATLPPAVVIANNEEVTAKVAHQPKIVSAHSLLCKRARAGHTPDALDWCMHARADAERSHDGSARRFDDRA
jgi:hypothetical protein